MGSCSCDYEQPSVINSRVVKARKEHRCGDCFRTISPGETYENTWGIWEGEASTHRVCADCLALRKWALAHVPCLCWSFGGLHGDVLEATNELDHECPGLYAEAQAKIAAIREKRRPTATAMGGVGDGG